MKRIHHALIFVTIFIQSIGNLSSAGELVAAPDINTYATSNIFLDKSHEWDLSLKPSAELGIDFSKIWSFGYTGELNAYLEHSDLLSHWHELYLFANPAWGLESENEFVIEASLETLRNKKQYSSLNLLQPSLLTKIILEPKPWFCWELSTKIVYRWFYDDSPSDSLDGWLAARASFTLPTRTTLSPKLAYGFRYYPNQETSVTSDDQDQQIKLGFHLSQELWSDAGLQIDYSYINAIGASGLLSRKLTQSQFAYFGQEFFYSGHLALIGFKQLLNESSSLGVNVNLDDRTYHGWTAVDGLGIAQSDDRHDFRLTPRLYISYVWSSDKEDSDSLIGLNLDYRYIRQWSNSDWYDTYAHIASLALWGSW
jgi:hypothetical protein